MGCGGGFTEACGGAKTSWIALLFYSWDVSFRCPGIPRPESNRSAGLGKKAGHPEERAVCRRPVGRAGIIVMKVLKAVQTAAKWTGAGRLTAGHVNRIVDKLRLPSEVLASTLYEERGWKSLPRRGGWV